MEMGALLVFAVFVALIIVGELWDYVVLDRCPACHRAGGLMSTGEREARSAWFASSDERVLCTNCGHSLWRPVISASLLLCIEHTELERRLRLADLE